MTKTKTTSPLGSLSLQYQTKQDSTGSILDSPDKGHIEIYPAGYTKPSNRDDCSRQEVFKSLYELAVVKGVENNLYPFEQKTHKLELLPDPLNPFDAKAIHIIFRAPSDSPLAHLDGRDLGFIPKKINTPIGKNAKMINGGRILKVKCNFHKKYYGAKVVFAYGDASFDPASARSLSRFSALLED